MRSSICRRTVVTYAAAATVIAKTSLQKAAAEALMPETVTTTGLMMIDTKPGSGASPEKGQTCVVHYTGWFYRDGGRGEKFDSSVDRGRPFEFELGKGMVISGWEEGVSTMKTGGKRTLIIPPELAYGPSGAGGVIPPHATLIFDIELLDVRWG